MKTSIFALVVTALALAFSVRAQPIIWKQLFPRQSPPGRSFHAMAFDETRREVILFGGVDSGGALLSDTWSWDGSSWSERFPGLAPSARHRHAMAFDSATRQIVLFGGVDKDGVRGDTWVWDGTTWNLKAPYTSPPARFGHAMAYDPARGEVVLFGGYRTAAILSDTWVWDGATWTQRSLPNSPGPRAFSALGFSMASSKLVLFGGLKPDGLASGETWNWDGAAWAQMSPANSPPARAWSVATPHPNGSVVLFGGASPTMSGVPLGDTWIWDGTNWTNAGTAGVPSRMFHAIAYDSLRRQSVLFSGVGDGSSDDVRGNVVRGAVLNDTWVLGVTHDFRPVRRW